MRATVVDFALSSACVCEMVGAGSEPNRAGDMRLRRTRGGRIKHLSHKLDMKVNAPLSTTACDAGCGNDTHAC